MKITTLSICTVFAMTLLTGEAGSVFAEPDMVQPPDSEQEAGPVEFKQVVQFEQDVHFLNQDGTDVVLPAGEYYVDPVQNGLRLKSADNEEAEAVIVQAEATTHDQSVEIPEVVSIKEGEDQQVVLVLLPDGKAMQAVGSSSGVRERGMTLSRAKVAPRTLTLIPQINGIFTIPRFGSISPKGTLYIKGKGFSTPKGQIILSVKNLFNSIVKYPLSVNEWSDTSIKATIPGNISNVPDHTASFVLKTTKGLGSRAWTVNFYADRTTHVLKRDEAAVRVTTCSRGADQNVCNGWNQSDPGACTFSDPKLRTDATFTIMHLNCDVAVDWDDGTDVLEVKLKNGWVIDKIDISGGGSSSSEKLGLPTELELKRSTYGTSVWNQKIPWEVSPGKDYVLYSFWVKIKGPTGVPY